MSTVAQPLARGYRTLRLPIAEADYERFMNDTTFARARLDDFYAQHPELFPPAWSAGYALYGFTEVSCKQHMRCRRLRLGADKTVWTVAPGFLLPYLSGRVEEVENALFLMRFHVPCWAIAYVFGRDAMYWYRLQHGLGRFSLVGTTVKTAAALPQTWSPTRSIRVSKARKFILPRPPGTHVFSAPRR